MTERNYIDIEKFTNGQDADSQTRPIIPVGDTATFTYQITNISDVSLSNVEVIDERRTQDKNLGTC